MASTAKRTLALALALALCANGAPFSALAEDAPGEPAAQSENEGPQDTGQPGEEVPPAETESPSASTDGATGGGDTAEVKTDGASGGETAPDTSQDTPPSIDDAPAGPGDGQAADTATDDNTAGAGDNQAAENQPQTQNPDEQAEQQNKTPAVTPGAAEPQESQEPSPAEENTENDENTENAENAEGVAPQESEPPEETEAQTQTATPPAPYLAEATYPDGSLLQIELPGGLAEGAQLNLETAAGEMAGLQQTWQQLGQAGKLLAGYTFTVAYLAADDIAMPTDARLEFTAAAGDYDADWQLLQLEETPALLGQPVACTAGEKAGLSLQSPRPGQYAVVAVDAGQTEPALEDPLADDSAAATNDMADLNATSQLIPHDDYVDHVDVEVGGGTQTIVTTYTDENGNPVGDPVTGSARDIKVTRVSSVTIQLKQGNPIVMKEYGLVEGSQIEYRDTKTKCQASLANIERVVIALTAKPKDGGEEMNLTYTSTPESMAKAREDCPGKRWSYLWGLDFTINTTDALTETVQANLSVKKTTIPAGLETTEPCIIGVYTAGATAGEYTELKELAVEVNGTEAALTLPAGTYYLKEKKVAAVAGYDYAETSWQTGGAGLQGEEYYPVTLAQDTLTAVVCNNTYTEIPAPPPAPGTLTVQKLVQEGENPAADETLKEKKFTFGVYTKAELPSPTDGGDQTAPDDAAQYQLVGETFTLADGESYTWPEAQPGTYYLHETDTAVPGYLPDGTTWQQGTDQTQAAYYPFAITEGGTTNVVCTNRYTKEEQEPHNGSLLLNETSNLGGDYYFDVYRIEGTQHAVPQRVMASAGATGPVLELEPGEYEIFEEDPSKEGYTVTTAWQLDGTGAVPDEQSHLHVVVLPDTQTAVICSNLYTLLEGEIDTGILAVAKTSNLDGTYNFTAYRKEGAEYRPVGGVAVQNGRVSSALRLETGSYYLAEIEADRAGYDLAVDWRINGKAATVNGDGYLPFTVEKDMAAVVECHNTYSLCTAGLALAKASNLAGNYRFRLYTRKDGNYQLLQGLAVRSGCNKLLTLPLGTYYLEEIEADRDGYVLDTQWCLNGKQVTPNSQGYLEIELTKAGAAVVCGNLYSRGEGTLRLSKTSNLAGDYTFAVYAAEGDTQPCKTVVVHSDGCAVVTLPQGHWYLAETNAGRDGYSLATAWCINGKAAGLTANGRLRIKVTAGGSVTVACGNNYTANPAQNSTTTCTTTGTSGGTPTSVVPLVCSRIPQTGDPFAFAAWAALAVCSLGGMVWLHLRRKKRNTL